MDQPTPEIFKTQRILEVLRGETQGLDRIQIQKEAQLEDLDPQVMRRLLLQMVKQGKIYMEGRTRARRYFLTGESLGQMPEPPARIETTDHLAESYPPLSEDGKAARVLVLRPLSKRPQVTYQRAFLDAYQPNETYYLSAALRSRMAELGGPKEPERPAGTYAREILQRLLVDLSWNSARLEGNTYTLLDTEKLIELGETAEGKDLQETQMILNHKAAIEFLVDSAEEIEVNPTTVQNLHALLTENLLANPMDEGKIRSSAVGIRGTSYIPTAVPQVIEECFRQVLRVAGEIGDPFEQSFFLLVHLPYLQPFIDGNKRTARLAANIPFIRKNFRPITFVDITSQAFTDAVLAVYEQNQVALLRDIYVFAYERSCARYGAVQASLGEPDPFRLRYRTDIKEIVRQVVLAGESFAEAGERIRAYAQVKLPKEVWTRFSIVVETELDSIHDGNFARYQLRPSEFAAWKQRGLRPESNG
jgi:Fic family protein